MDVTIVERPAGPEEAHHQCAYKYLKKQHALSFKWMGEIQIGTLGYYRDIEKHGAQIGDAKEGEMKIYCDDPEIDLVEPFDNVPRVVKSVLNLEKGSNWNYWKIKNIIFEQPVKTNAYIYCMSAEYDEKLYDDFEADACVRIYPIPLFLARITTILHNKGKIAFPNNEMFFGYQKIQYRGRRINYREEDQVNPIWLKEDRYAYQKEVRAAWVPKDENPEPFVIACDELTEFCHEYMEREKKD